MKKLPSKIIQISVSPESGEHWGLVYALCEDGSLWKITTAPNDTRWQMVHDAWGA